MDATRARHPGFARQKWYARCRQLRFARFLGFPTGPAAANHSMQDQGIHRIAVQTP